MRIPINLASEPFRKDRPIVAASAVLSLILVGLLGLLVFLIASERTRMRDTRREIARLSASVDSMTREQAQLDAVLRQPANAVVLERSLLLNALVDRKSISWTRIFADLESVMPYSVRLIQVRLPQINTRNQVSLDMTVGATDPGFVIAFIKRLEASPLFGPATVHNSSPPSPERALEPLPDQRGLCPRSSKQQVSIQQVRDPRVLVRIVLGVLVVLNLAAAVMLLFPPGGTAEEMEAQLASLEGQAMSKEKTLQITRQHVAAVEKGRSQGDQFLGSYFLSRRTAYSTLLDELGADALKSQIKPRKTPTPPSPSRVPTR